MQKFFEGNYEFLFDKKNIYFVNIDNFCFEIYSQRNFFGEDEIIIGSRKINGEELAFVFQNVRNPNENLIIKYYKNSKN